MKNYFPQASSLLLLICTASAWANPVMQPGAWTSSAKITAINPNTGKKVDVGNTTVTTCLTKDFLATDPYLTASIDLQKMQQKGADCSTSAFSRSGNSAHWKMECTMANGARISSKISASVAKLKYSIRMDQVTRSGNKPVKVTILVNSKRSGECTDSMMRP